MTGTKSYCPLLHNWLIISTDLHFTWSACSRQAQGAVCGCIALHLSLWLLNGVLGHEIVMLFLRWCFNNPVLDANTLSSSCLLKAIRAVFTLQGWSSTPYLKTMVNGSSGSCRKSQKMQGCHCNALWLLSSIQISRNIIIVIILINAWVKAQHLNEHSWIASADEMYARKPF